MHKPPKIQEKRVIARTRLFCVEALELEFGNGVHASYERLLPNFRAAVLVVPVMNDGETVMLIREYAAGVHRYELGFPKGRIEEGEDILAAANRELMEETGFGARRLEHLKTFTIAPGLTGHLTEVVLARDLYPQKQQGDEPEEVEVVPWRLSDTHRLLEQEDCTEARSVAALYMVKEKLKATRRG